MFFYRKSIKFISKKSKFITSKTIAGLLIFALLIQVYPITAYASTITEDRIIELTNNDRLNNNLKPLKSNQMLNNAAIAKANDMIAKNYFDHFGPNGEKPWDFIKNENYKYSFAGENLAMDFRTAEGVEKAFMNSPSHRDNILNNNFEDIGVSVTNGQLEGHLTTLIVVMFGKQYNNIFSIIDMKTSALTTKITSYILGFRSNLW